MPLQTECMCDNIQFQTVDNFISDLVLFRKTFSFHITIDFIANHVQIVNSNSSRYLVYAVQHRDEYVC